MHLPRCQSTTSRTLKHHQLHHRHRSCLLIHVHGQKVQQTPQLQTQPVDQQEQLTKQNDSNPLVEGLVSAMTESLRLLGVGKQQYESIALQPSPNPPLEPGMTDELVKRLTADFNRAYFVTGLIDDSIYEADCTFVDPTVKFSGVDLWKRNLQLLVPFLMQPKITLQSTRMQGSGEPVEVEADWELTTWLSLPWKPYVQIQGKTVYTLNADANKIVRHEEFWNESPVAAILMLLKPGPPVPDSVG